MARPFMRELLALLLIVFGVAAHAEPYRYKDNFGSWFDSASAACQSNVEKGAPSYLYQYLSHSLNPLKEGQWQCAVVYEIKPEHVPNYGYSTAPVNFLVDRYGDSCEDGKEYDPVRGECKADCSKTVGDPFPARGPDSPVINSGGRNYVADGAAPAACYQQCQYKSDSGRATSCYLVKGSTTQGFCNYILNGTGESCGADSYQFATTGDQLNPPTDPQDPATPPSDPNDPGCPEGWAWSGTTCVKTDPSNPGDGSGSGEGDGGGNSGGGNSGGGNSGGGDGSGNGNGDGTGNGDGSGSGNGNGDGSGSGNGDGDGEGQCDPAKDPNGCQGNGPSSELSEPKAGSWDEANKEWEQKVQEAKKDLKEAVKANIDQLKGAFDLQLSTGGGQLPCEAFTVWGKSYRLCVADYSTQLSYMRLALLLMAALIAAFVILKE
ncbi:attachment protein [Pseudomonas nitroreducens]|uniref:attachment protein n=1 Tax=Pseudomonas nitroreducens TaxID=46680 RepID=UPI0026592F43|nr:attachment protein [Pseudomonas nitroreducens]MCP1649312.1 hypothetical protein [Pseudomonas nitroreducens]MCP1684727.1 hypothetical protein [Pseudomonas nitroreducens]